MRQRFFKARGYIAGLFAILLSLCLALGLAFALPRAVYADGDDDGQTVLNWNEWVKEVNITTFDGNESYIEAIEAKGWTKGFFDREVYVFSAEAKYGNDELYFRIYCAGEGAFSAVTYSEGINLYGENDNTAFRLAQYGHVPEYVSDALNGLEAGVYYLLACVPETFDSDGTINNEYSGLNNRYLTDEEIIEAGFAFTVTPAEGLTGATFTNLNIVQWTLGDFDNSKNVIIAETNAGLENVTYKISYDNGGKIGSAVINLSEFKTDANGVIVDIYTIDTLRSLIAGKYWLTGTVNTADGDIVLSTPFNVKIHNYWEVVPSLISWNEGHFDVNDNVLYGTAKIGQVKFTISDEKDNVLYTVVKNGDGVITSVTGADGETLHISVLNKLAVGSYKLTAEVESTDNYSSLETVAHFAVFEDSVALSGIIAAAVTFAVIDLIAAGLCIALLIIRRRKIENQFRKMVRRELNRG